MNNNLEPQQMQYKQHYISNKNKHIQRNHHNSATYNRPTYISNNNNISLSSFPPPHTLNIHSNTTTLNTNINPNINYIPPYQTFPLPTYPTHIINNHIYPQHTNPPILPSTNNIHNKSVANVLSTIHEQQNEEEIQEKNDTTTKEVEEQENELNVVDDNEDFIKANNINNPWFNEEIASIVKLHRKTARKYHRSKTKPKELKQLCKKLEKKKRKLIRDAKEKYMRELIAKKCEKSVTVVQNDGINLDSNANENKNEVSSGYIALDVIQPICSIIWRKYWDYWSSGNHWKIDVDDILESINIDKEMELVQLVNTVQDGARKYWYYYSSGDHWKMDVEDILEID